MMHSYLNKSDCQNKSSIKPDAQPELKLWLDVQNENRIDWEHMQIFRHL